jgi:uncharacterized membrane protein
MAFHENYKRSILKAITYRFIILLCDGLIIFAITRQYDTTVKVIVLSNIGSTILYIVHERAWNKIHWGKSRKSAT